MAKVIDSTASEFSKSAARGKSHEPIRKKKTDYKHPANQQVAKLMYSDLLGLRRIVRVKMKTLESRYANGHKRLSRSAFSNERAAIYNWLSEVGMCLKWVKDYLRSQGVVKFNAISDRAA